MYVLNQTIVVGTYFLRYILVEKLDIRLNNTFIKSFLTSACIGAIIKRKTCEFFVKSLSISIEILGNPEILPKAEAT